MAGKDKVRRELCLARHLPPTVGAIMNTKEVRVTYRCHTTNCDNTAYEVFTKTEGDVYTHINGMRLDPNNLVTAGLCSECLGRLEEEKEIQQTELI